MTITCPTCRAARTQLRAERLCGPWSLVRARSRAQHGADSHGHARVRAACDSTVCAPHTSALASDVRSMPCHPLSQLRDCSQSWYAAPQHLPISRCVPTMIMSRDTPCHAERQASLQPLTRASLVMTPPTVRLRRLATIDQTSESRARSHLMHPRPERAMRRRTARHRCKLPR